MGQRETAEVAQMQGLLRALWLAGRTHRETAGKRVHAFHWEARANCGTSRS